MAVLRPDQVPPYSAQKILDFLNRAESPQEIASGIELPGEPDIGLALARRILDRREELGGHFTSLEQLLEIPYIGPERFTDIVHALAPETTGGGGEVAGLEQLAARIDALQQEIMALSAKAGMARRLTLSSQRDRVYLGQPVLFTARFTESASDRPLVGYPVTFFTQWGVLRPVTGTDTEGGTSITITTGMDGTAQALLCVSTGEPFTIDQENALLAALDKMPSHAPVPRDAQQALEGLARIYASSAGLMLRKAIDILLRHFHPAPWESVNLHGFPEEWVVYKGAVIAMVQGGLPESLVGPVSGDSSVQVSAVSTLSVVDWLPAWLEIFAKVQEERWKLEDRLRGVKDLAGGRYSVPGVMTSHIHEMVSFQRGIAGEYAGKRCVEKAASSFLQNDLSDMPADVQSSVYAGLSAASRSVAATGLKGWQSMVQQQQAIELNVNSIIATKADAQALERFRDQLQAEIDSSVSAAMQDLGQKIDERFSSVTEEMGAINDKMQQMVSKSELQGVRDELQAEINARVSKQELEQVTSRIDEIATEMDRRFQNSVTRAELAETENRLSEAINARASLSDLNAIDTRLRALDNATTTMRTRLNKLDSDVEELRIEIPGRPS